MKKLKNAEEIIIEHYGCETWEGVCGTFLANVSPTMIKEIVRIAQINAIEATVEKCTEEACVEIIEHEEINIDRLPGYEKGINSVILPIYGVDSDSIIDVADKMKEEL